MDDCQAVDRPLSISTDKLGVISCMSINYSSKHHLAAPLSVRRKWSNDACLIGEILPSYLIRKLVGDMCGDQSSDNKNTVMIYYHWQVALLSPNITNVRGKAVKNTQILTFVIITPRWRVKRRTMSRSDPILTVVKQAPLSDYDAAANWTRKHCSATAIQALKLLTVAQCDSRPI